MKEDVREEFGSLRGFVPRQWMLYVSGLVIVALWLWVCLATDLGIEGFSAGATLILAFVVLRDSHLTRELAVTSLEKTFAEQQRLQRVAAQPVVTCLPERVEADIHLVVRNSGLTPARNVVITLDDDLLMESLEDPWNVSDLVGFLRYPIPALAADAEIRARISLIATERRELEETTVQRFICAQSRPVTGQIAYDDMWGNALTEPIGFDFRTLEYLKLTITLDRHTYDPIGNVLEAHHPARQGYHRPHGPAVDSAH